MLRKFASILSVAVVSATLGSHAAFANQGAPAAAATCHNDLQRQVNLRPVNKNEISSLVSNILSQEPAQINSILSCVTPATTDAVANGASDAYNQMRSNNPDGSQLIENAVVKSWPNFQSAFLRHADAEATAAIGDIGAAPTTNIAGIRQGGVDRNNANGDNGSALLSDAGNDGDNNSDSLVASSSPVILGEEPVVNNNAGNNGNGNGSDLLADAGDNGNGDGNGSDLLAGDNGIGNSNGSNPLANAGNNNGVGNGSDLLADAGDNGNGDGNGSDLLAGDNGIGNSNGSNPLANAGNNNGVGNGSDPLANAGNNGNGDVASINTPNANTSAEMNALQNILDQDPLDEAAVENLVSNMLTSDPSQINTILSLITPATTNAVGKGAYSAYASLRTTNPEGSKTIENAVIGAGPAFQSAFLINSDEEATAAIGDVGAAPVTVLPGARQGGPTDNSGSASPS